MNIRIHIDLEKYDKSISRRRCSFGDRLCTVEFEVKLKHSRSVRQVRITFDFQKWPFAELLQPVRQVLQNFSRRQTVQASSATVQVEQQKTVSTGERQFRRRPRRLGSRPF